MSQDYNDTLNLPKTNFQMRANLAVKEPDILKFWDKQNIYKIMHDISFIYGGMTKQCIIYTHSIYMYIYTYSFI